MRVEQLRYLDAVIRCGSMRRAGEELHLSQPALSESIRNLERELGVTLLERLRSGARISEAGRELLPLLTEVLDAVDRLRAAAGDYGRTVRTVRVGTVHAATVPIMAPAIRDLNEACPDARVEVRTCQQDEIRDGLLAGTIDLGLVNLLDTEVEAAADAVPGLVQSELARGTAVVCCRADSELASSERVSVEQLLAGPFVFMRPGYVMHRFVERLFGAGQPAVAYYADGADMGKTMVAEGLGATVLPDFSVAGDPLVRAGLLTTRPLAGPRATVVLVLQGRRSRHRSEAVRALESALIGRAGGALPTPVPRDHRITPESRFLRAGN